MDQVEEREREDPDQVDDVPVQPAEIDRRGDGTELAAQRGARSASR